MAQKPDIPAPVLKTEFKPLFDKEAILPDGRKGKALYI